MENITKDGIAALIGGFLENDPANRISEEAARHPEYAGLRFFEAPLIGYAAADDAYLRSLAGNAAAGIDLRQADDWLPGAKTVISVFLRFTDDIRSGNRASGRPTDLWQQGRVTGQVCLVKAAVTLRDMLIGAGYGAVAPLDDPHLNIIMENDAGEKTVYSSDWSERHVAYAAGLGTFSLSKGLITKNGVAGRFMSVVTTLALPPTPRPYSGLEDYCTFCGACAKRCPGGAISLETGKDHVLCVDYLGSVRSEDLSYYGCGQCQCGVPCEARIPGR